MTETIYEPSVRRTGRLSWQGYVNVQYPQGDNSPFSVPVMELGLNTMGVAHDVRAFTRRRLERKLARLIEWDKRR